MEILNIVDENDNVIGKGTRDSVHKKYRIHRGVHILIINKKGEILIQKRSPHKDDRPGFYDASVGAQVLAGETYRQAAIREAKEELGITVKNLRKICKYKSFSKRQREIRTLFIAYHNGPFKIQKEEVDMVKFFHIKEILQMLKSEDFTKGCKISLEYLIKYLKKGINLN